jgi:regulator of RNase E activity RraA
MLEALDDLKPMKYTFVPVLLRMPYGENYEHTSTDIGGWGSVVTGIPEIPRYIDLNFPTFLMALCPGSGSQRKSNRLPGTYCNRGRAHQSGDIIIGDMDGVCIIPRSAEKELLSSLEKATGEKKVKKAILAGMSAKDSFEKFGIM